jgi:hypothetical protein
MNILQRIGAALVGQIEREHKATSLNTAEPTESDEQKGRRIASYYGVELPISPEPDWKAIAGELAAAIEEGINECWCTTFHDNDLEWPKMAENAYDHYEAAKQVHP